MDLNRLYEKYRSKGLVVVAVTNESRSLVDEYVRKNAPKYPVIVESVDSGETFGIVGGYPTQYVIDAAGKIAWAGNFFDADPRCEEILERLLKDAWIAPELTPNLAAQAKLVAAKKFGEASLALAKVAADDAADAADRKAADAMVKWLREDGDKAVAAAQAREKAGDVAEAAAAYETIAAQWAGTDPATKAADALTALLADKTKKKEVDAAKAFAKVQEKVAPLTAAKALPLWKLFIVKWKGTKAAAEAARLVKRIESVK